MKRQNKKVAGENARLADHSRHFRPNLFCVPAVVFFAIAIQSPLNWGQSSNATDDVVGRIYLEAQEANRLGNYRDAARKFRAILSIQPGSVEARVNLGLMEHLLGEHAEAIKQFEIVVAQQPQLFVANLFLGLDLLEVHEPGRALGYLESAERIKPNDLQSALQLGRAYADLHQFQQANEWYLRATSIGAEHAEAWYGVGVTYLHLARAASDRLAKEGQASVYARKLYAESLEERGSFRDAASVYERILLSASAPACLHAELGFAYLAQGDEKLVSDAATQFDLALAGDNGCVLARVGAARIDFQRQELVKALTGLKNVWDLDANFLIVNAGRLWQGLDSETTNNLEKAIKTTLSTPSFEPFSTFLTKQIEQSRKQEPDSTVSLNQQGSGPVEIGPTESQAETRDLTPTQLYAEGRYTSCAQELRPRFHQASGEDLLLLAACSQDSGDYRLSLEAANQLLDKDAHSVPALYWKARASQKLGFEALTRAALENPNSPRIHLLLAEAYREKENFTEAEAEYNSALKLDSNYVSALVGLAMVYWQQQKYDEAVQQLNRVLVLRPGDPESSYIMADILVKRLQFNEALPYLNSALSGKSTDLPHVHALRGKIYAAQGNVKAAVTEMKQSLNDDPNGAYHYQLYRLYKKLGNEEAARTALRESDSLRKRNDGTIADSATSQP